jgi:hypothetical protein
VKGKNLPMLYCLLKKKQQKTYEEMFQFIFERIDCCPVSVMVDFEKAIHNALRKVARKQFNLV